MNTIKQEVAARTEAEKNAFESKVETLMFFAGAIFACVLVISLFMELAQWILFPALGLVFGIIGSLYYLGLIRHETAQF